MATSTVSPRRSATATMEYPRSTSRAAWLCPYGIIRTFATYVLHGLFLSIYILYPLRLNDSHSDLYYPDCWCSMA